MYLGLAFAAEGFRFHPESDGSAQDGYSVGPDELDIALHADVTYAEMVQHAHTVRVTESAHNASLVHTVAIQLSVVR